MMRLLCAITLAVAVGFCAKPADAVIVRMEFSFSTQGEQATALIRLYGAASPRSVANFLTYAEGVGQADSYDGTFIHRVPEALGGGPGRFVVQGGGFTFDGNSGLAVPITTADPIPDEPGGGVPGVSNTRGTISFAKSGPNTVTSQWFVNLGNNTGLDNPTRPDGGFNAFGRVLQDDIELFDGIDTLPRLSVGVAGSSTVFREVPVIPSGNQNFLLLLTGVEVGVFSDVDYNLDGAVTADDFAVWRQDFGSLSRAEADGNGDAFVNAADYVLLRDRIGESPAVAPSVAIPEPATASGLLAALSIATGLRRRRR